MKNGFSGRIASGFLESKISSLLMVGLLIIGLYSASLIPREEEPQIDVPMVDVMIGYPGASPQEVERRVLEPLEKILSNIKGVEHLHSTAQNGQAMIIVQYYVGEDIERSYVKLYDELIKNMDKMPEGVYPPLIKSRSIDDVPMLGLTFWSETYDDYEIRQLTEEVANEVKKIKDVSSINFIGGRSRELKVQLDKDKLAQNNLDALSIMQLIQANNKSMPSGSFVQNDQEFLVTTGQFLATKEDVANLVVGVNSNMPVYLGQVAEIIDGPASSSDYVSFGYSQYSDDYLNYPSEYNAVTLSIAKVQGSDAMIISDQILDKVEQLKTEMIPSDIKMEITRNYGETASDKVGELFSSLFLAIIVVTGLVAMSMGWRGGLVVFLSVPLTFALTLFSYYMLGYTLNRITLFALVFVVGIVVDDSIIITENMHRHFKMRRLPFKDAALYAINEVGNPTILATFIVIASILPMAFVSGMMGPYMSPMPIGASIAMFLSLVIALTITPYLGFHLLREKDKQDEKDAKGEDTTWFYKFYNKYKRPFLESRSKRIALFATVAVLFGASMMMFFNKSVVVKMLPFDNKNEFQVVIDMPEGTTLERTSAVTQEIAQYLRTVEEVVNYQSYVGASAPITFNGLVRHYDLRSGSHMADIQVNLLHKDDRKLQSHDIAKKVRPGVQEIAKKHGANVKIVEVPPGPPVLSTVVAEIYGPDYEEQIKVASQVKTLLENTDDIVDVDWSVESNQTEYIFHVDREKAMLNGIVPEQVVGNLTYILREQGIANLYDPNSAMEVPIVFALEDSEKTRVQDLLNLKVKGQQGNMVSVGDIVTVEETIAQKSISRKDQQRVVYVLADMAGKYESPVYAILGMEDKLKELSLPTGYSISDLYMGQPEDESNFVVKWDGEWQITLEVFRDLGIAFMVVMVMIYMLIVGWFQNYVTPMVMMIAIPLSLIGIVAGHMILGAFFTATSFIGMIALVGIMVRNSVLIIDFIEIRLKDGIPIKDAIIDGVAVRTVPVLLTAGTVVIGAVVILFDPIFQGLAISLVGGAIVSTLLTLFLVPIVYYLVERKKWAHLEE